MSIFEFRIFKFVIHLYELVGTGMLDDDGVRDL